MNDQERRRADKAVSLATYDEQAISLIRVSTTQQAFEDRAGIPAQREAIEKIARQRNLTVPTGWHFEIAGVSGCAVSVTPQMAQVLRIIKSGECRAIILKEASRLMRPDNTEDYAILEQFRKHNVKIHLPDATFDLRNPSDMLHAMICFGFSGYERTLIRDRMLNGKLSKRKAGQWIYGANTPYGMRVVEINKQHFLAEDEETIESVKRLFKLRLSGVSSRAELIRATGLKYSNIYFILRNETYTGWFVTKKKCGDIRRNFDGTIKSISRLTRPADEWERFWVMGDAKAPISVADFNKVQALLNISTRQRSRSVSKLADQFLYRGLLRCAECGRNIMTIQYANPQVESHCGYYTCKRGLFRKGSEVKHRTPEPTCVSRRMRRDVLEPMLDEIVSKYFADPEFLVNLIEQQEKALSRHEERAVEIDRLQRGIAAAEHAIQTTIKLFQRQVISEKQFDADLEQFGAEKQAATQALRELQPDVAAIPPEAWRKFALRFRVWKKLTFQQRRQLLVTIAPVFSVAGYQEGNKKRPRVVVTGCTINLTRQEIDLTDDEVNSEETVMTASHQRTRAAVAEDRSLLVTSGRHSCMSAQSNQSSIYLPLQQLAPTEIDGKAR